MTTRQELYEIWLEALEIDGFSEEEDFFYLGGDSLRATILVNLLDERLGTEVGVGFIFENPGFSEFATAFMAL